MENKQLLKNIAFKAPALLLIVLGTASRLLPHPANFTAITGVAIFSGNPFIPLSAMLLSDLIIGFDSIEMRISVYGSIILAAFIGRLIRKNPKIMNIASASLASSVLFFIITNYAVFQFGSLYTKNLSGLLTSYTLAIPFFRNAILGDLFYTGMLFGIQKLLSINQAKLGYNSSYVEGRRGKKNI